MTTDPLCPRCRQDHLRRWLLVPTGEQIAVCPECDATWPADTAPTERTFTDYEDFMAARGFGYYFDQLRPLS